MYPKHRHISLLDTYYFSRATWHMRSMLTPSLLHEIYNMKYKNALTRYDYCLNSNFKLHIWLVQWVRLMLTWFHLTFNNLRYFMSNAALPWEEHYSLLRIWSNISGNFKSNLILTALIQLFYDFSLDTKRTTKCGQRSNRRCACGHYGLKLYSLIIFSL